MGSGVCSIYLEVDRLELREIKSIPYTLPYSAEFQKGTSENTLPLEAVAIGLEWGPNYVNIAPDIRQIRIVPF
jgi:hypothetical protein